MKGKTTLSTFQYAYVENDESLDLVIDKVLQVLTENNLYEYGFS